MVKINKYAEIVINDINLEDQTFGFSFPQELDGLTESISKVGLIHPVTLYQNRIVCGRRRILVFKKLGREKVPAGIIEGNYPEIELFRLNLEDNLSTREFNIIEKSIILNKLLNLLHVPQDEIIKKYLPLLNIPSNIKYLKKYLWLEELDDKLKQMTLETKVSFDTLNMARDWPQNKRNEILCTVLSFGFGTNKIAEILTLLNDISLRDNSTVESPLQTEEWLKIKNDPQIPSYQKGMKLKDLLLLKRYPMHTEFKNKVKSLIAKLNLPKNVTVELDELLTWENDSIDLKVKCKKKEDLEQTIKKLSNLSNSPELDELLEALRVSR